MKYSPINKYRRFYTHFIVIALILIPGLTHASEKYAASVVPWSGYWWPTSIGGLANGTRYRGHPAPLEKYEILTRGINTGPSVTWYNTIYYDPDVPAWYGHCGDWAQAACYEQYEILPSSHDNIIFRVGDKKGLLTLSHDNDFSERVNGAMPDIFHYWLLYYIKEQGKAFVADLDAGEEAWNYPIYQYEMENEIIGNRESVTVTIYYADDNVHPDFTGTKERKQTLTYDLFINENNEITGGEWTGQSITEHPQALHFPLKARTSCPYLDYEEVVRLARSKDDFLEKGSEKVLISPGKYNLILMDEDIYQIDSLPGDTVSVKVEKQDGSYEDIIVTVRDGKGNIVKEAVANSENAFDLITKSETPLTLTLTQNDYNDPNIYTLQTDLIKSFQQKIPYVPKQGMWSGFALTNPNESEVTRVMLTAHTEEGIPLQTLLGPLQMPPGEKRLFFFNDLPWRRHELSDIDSLCLMSDGDVRLLNLFGNSNDSLACFKSSGTSEGLNHLIIPDTTAPMTPGKTMFGSSANISFEELPVTFQMYSGQGMPGAEIYEIISPRQNLSIRPGNYPLPASGWIEITAEENYLTGFQYLSSRNRAESLFALPVRSSKKIVPHIPAPGEWITSVTLINPNDTDNQLIFHLKLAGENTGDDLIMDMLPREKKKLDIQNQFGKEQGDSLYHSILEITGQYPFAGYFSYRTIDNEDEASLPLMDDSDLKSELVLPHYAGYEHGWWTGIGICNPISFSQTVRIEPHDSDGKLMREDVTYLPLSSGAYEVMLVESLFPETGDEISFIRFIAPQGVIGGFYLYGSRREGLSGSALLSGAIMD